MIVKISQAKADTNKLILLSIIAENASEEIWPIYNNEMGKLAAKLQNSSNNKIKICAKRHLAASLNNKGFFFTERGISYKAILYFNKSLLIQHEINDLEGQAYSLSNLGTIYDSKGEIDKALEFYFDAMKIREKLGNKISLAQSYNNIAVLYSNQNDLVNAMKYHFQSLKIRKLINDPEGLALAYNNIGTAYTHMVEIQYKGKYEVPDTLMNKSLEYFQKGYDSFKIANNKHGIALSLFNIGDYYVLQADCFFQKNSVQFDTLILKSETIFIQCLNIFNELDDKAWVANCTNSLANVYWRLNKNQKAKFFGEKAMVLAKELGFPGTIQKSADILRKIYQDNHEYEKALFMSDLSYSMRDSVINENNKKQSLSKYYLYQNEKQSMLAKANQEKIELVFLAKTKQQSIIIYFVISGLVVLILFAFFIYNRFKVSQKQKKTIELKNRETEFQKAIIEENQKATIDSINYAKRIQYALLANDELLENYLGNYFVLFKPKDIVSGDFYWATEHNNKFYLAVCDCTGHGVPGAFMSLLNIGFLSEAIKEKNISKPNEILNYVRKRLMDSIGNDGQQDGMDGILVCFDKVSNLITYAAANNEPILISNRQIIELPKDKMPVGKGEKTESFTLQTIEYKTGDVLYLYTDGFADQFGGPKGKKFKYKSLNELLLSNSIKIMPEQNELLHLSLNSWQGNLEQVDDICVIGIKL